MNVVEYAERRLADQSNEDHETQYWAAYLDGARVAMAILGLIKWKCRSQTGEDIKP